jgi:dTDP-glucose 4,6-dehydratase
VKPLPIEDLEFILSHTRTLWEEVRGQRIFLSGATGFFGAWLLESLAHCNRRLNLNLTATVLTREPETFARRMPHLAIDSAIHLHSGDIRRFDFPDPNYPFVIHAATPTSASPQPLELMSTILDGTAHMLEFARTRGAQKFLFISSGAVYGAQPQDISHIPETYSDGPEWLNPNAVYAESKRRADQMCAIHAADSQISFAIARCFAFVGPHLPLDQHFAIGNFIADAMAGRGIRISGDGTPVRSYLYAADLAIWLWTLLFRGASQPANLNVFNVGSAQALSVRELAQIVVEEVNPSLKIEIAREPTLGAPRQQYVPDVGKAETCLGLRQNIDLRDAIRRTAAWYR